MNPLIDMLPHYLCIDTQVVKVWWYLTHVAMENPRVRKHGFVLLGNDKDMKLRHFYPKRVLGKSILCILSSGSYLVWFLFNS